MLFCNALISTKSSSQTDQGLSLWTKRLPEQYGTEQQINEFKHQGKGESEAKVLSFCDSAPDVADSQAHATA